MSVKFVRIDDRLLHGQVVTTWLKRYDIEQAIIVSEEVAQDKTRQMILKLAAPSGLRVVFFSPEKLIKVLQKCAQPCCCSPILERCTSASRAASRFPS